jgi:hypothetical protein
MDELENFARRSQVDTERPRIAGLGAQTAQQIEQSAIVQDGSPGSTAGSAVSA